MKIKKYLSALVLVLVASNLNAVPFFQEGITGAMPIEVPCPSPDVGSIIRCP